MISTPHHRRGITLTEILIAILIMGVGITSLMTLFPLGMYRLRDAQRYSRSGLLVESAYADLGVRNLLSKGSFLNVYSGQYNTLKAYTPWPYDPWVQDTPSYDLTAFVSADPIAGTSPGAYRGHGSFNKFNPTGHNSNPPFIAGPGLPVAYDPLWRFAANSFLGGGAMEGRFASGLGFVRPDPNPGTTKTADPSAHGLQRITNFPQTTLLNVPDVFVSPDDMVLQSDSDTSNSLGSTSTIVPDLNLVPKATTTGLPAIQNDWKYTWMFTGQQADATNGTVFVGDVVVFENRQFGADPAPTYFTPLLGSGGVATGETVVEAVFGYTNNITPVGNKVGYGSAANRAVLLRWSAAMPDPELRVGSWIADVTYERNAAEDLQRTVTDPVAVSAGAFYPYQRCYWYQVAKRTEANPASNKFTGDAKAGMREMTVWVGSPLRALTLLNATGEPYHVNAALVCPSVINVFPRTIYTR